MELNSRFYRTDWQGTSLLYPSARTNYAFNTEALNLWTAGGTTPAVVTANDTTAPNGTVTADKVVFGAAGAAGSYISDTAGNRVAINQKRVLSIWAKGNAGGEKLRFDDGLTAGTVTLTTDWARYQVALVAQASGRFWIYTATGTATVWLWGAQIDQGVDAATAYYPNPNASPTVVTVTDYTLSNGVITLAQAPVTGATLSYDNSVLPSPYYIFATGDGVRTQFAYDGVWGTLSANSGKGNGIWQIDLRGAQSYQLVKSAGAETATVNMTLKRDALQYKNTAGTWSVT